MPERILSICIPTYNRADILDKTLSKLILEPSFQSGRVEICISDNASTDNTKTVVKKYKDIYNNIIYSRNKENTGIIDGNFPIVAALASGTFIKFLNDYAYFIPGELDKIIEFVEENEKEKPVLFFSNHNLRNKNDATIYCESLDSLVETASYWMTWVLCAGMWRDDFIMIKDRDRSIMKFMWCPDNYLRLVSSGRPVIIYNKSFCLFHNLNKKGGYNFYKVFVENYLSLYNEYLKSRRLKPSIYRKERKKLYKYYLIPITISYLNSSYTEYNFDTRGGLRILFREYWHNPYFYIGLARLGIRYLVNKPILKNSLIYIQNLG